ncbi:MAG: NAD(P)/FAD-dependent oxidoreductase, partial [Prevotella sp.]|nr:NAD(P)/FAD-dependent oxidoreductase [Prevotella sp.]
MKRIAVIGGGAAGFFFAINLKEMAPDAHVTIFEKGKRVLRKVEISGGGRCNCTNTFAHVKDLSAVYPRGHRLMKRLFNVFNQHDAMQWFERHGVKLTIQPDDCVFPASQDAHTIIDCFLRLTRQHDINIVCNSKISSLDELDKFDDVLVTTGGAAQPKSLEWLQRVG